MVEEEAKRFTPDVVKKADIPTWLPLASAKARSSILSSFDDDPEAILEISADLYSDTHKKLVSSLVAHAETKFGYFEEPFEIGVNLVFKYLHASAASVGQELPAVTAQDCDSFKAQLMMKSSEDPIGDKLHEIAETDPEFNEKAAKITEALGSDERIMFRSGVVYTYGFLETAMKRESGLE